MNYSEDEEFDDYWDYHEKLSQILFTHTLYVSIFIAVSWALTYIIPPLLPSDRTLTWSDVMKFKMGRVEMLVFILFTALSVDALVMYALTNEEGPELSDFVIILFVTMGLNAGVLVLIVVFQYAIKPLICKPPNRAAASSSITHSDSFNFQENALNINSL
ncbi:hypothetical protein TrLO_g12973 [Triparma laevis f. longispina]|uniref:Uncharacterized protein n=1 Tax=Triparma laevis f. longispina TaxID=1714387 RepID=A0A9W7FI72_9STRA|nr:hypothetical protein TrLO_g12973 [Triparma laevis f. longispina]